MDYNDHIDNSDEDHSYDVENDEYDDEELYDLVVAGCHVAVTLYVVVPRHIQKNPLYMPHFQVFISYILICF